MYLNAQTTISHSHVKLIPYLPQHVKTYHSWMQNEQLRQLTASDLLSYEEELSNCHSWRTDNTKLTFLSANVASRDKRAELLGDINLFLSTEEPDDDDVGGETVVGEINMMIASSSTRGQGHGTRVLAMFVWWVGAQREAVVKEYLGETDGNQKLEVLVAKIDGGNVTSIGLFGKLGFTKVREEVNYFGEVEMRVRLDKAVKIARSLLGGTEPVVEIYDE
ncbi:hypothetical protein BT63DRAFT_442363 [Microthyrium microscopicum]|uniref:N-acetyltransferase domain-containing protein n=1 Tax=Microthyrium microscopicum TaxID=703497 RepID=A0A6A6U183_9PEZI|nr:hypothetical protein BT63DRAFT_442363 [Microthyrium microscopicum]